MISIYTDREQLGECESVIIIPERAINENGYIKVHTIKDSAHAKHEYHAMAQMAYYQYQDDELEVREMSPPLTIDAPQEKIVMDDGMLLYRQEGGDFYAVTTPNQNKKKLFEAGYRYCTRWVRLDI